MPSQFQPDPEFPTVVSNPEEKGALDAAMAYADEQGCHLILANDPDADRLAVAEKEGSSWTVFKGTKSASYSDIGRSRSEGERCHGGGGGADYVVSSRMLKAIAEKEGLGTRTLSPASSGSGTAHWS